MTKPMITTVTRKNRITIPVRICRIMGIRPGSKLEWMPVEGKDEIIVRLIFDRGETARDLAGAGKNYGPNRDAVAELIAERETD